MLIHKFKWVFWEVKWETSFPSDLLTIRFETSRKKIVKWESFYKRWMHKLILTYAWILIHFTFEFSENLSKQCLYLYIKCRYHLLCFWQFSFSFSVTDLGCFRKNLFTIYFSLSYDIEIICENDCLQVILIGSLG